MKGRWNLDKASVAVGERTFQQKQLHKFKALMVSFGESLYVGQQ